jgi:glucokinase
MILAGDIGGTNTRLAVFDEDLNMIGPPVKFLTAKLGEFERQASELVKRHSIEIASIAIAGPVKDGRVTMTNVANRVFDQHEMRTSLGLKSLCLINDLVANASGIELLSDDETVTILEGIGRAGNRVVVSPGTGLGEGGLIWDGHHHRPSPTEGGHAYFSPSTKEEVDFWLFLGRQLQVVRWEDALSGRGLENLFDYFVYTGTKVDGAVTRALAEIDKPRPGERAGVIGPAGLDGACEACQRAVHFFIRLLGIEAANAALKYFAIGGVFLGGGIPPRFEKLVRTDLFKQAFLAHGTMGPLLAEMPVTLVLNDDTALQGAALYGKRYGQP